MHVLLCGSYSGERYRAATGDEIERMLSAPGLDRRSCPPGRGTDVFLVPGDGDEQFWSAWHARHGQDETPAGDITGAAGKLGRDAGQSAASWVFDGSTPEQTCRRVLRGIEDGDPEIMNACQAPGLAADGGYTETDLAGDLGLAAGDEALPGAVTAYLDAAGECFWHEVEHLAREHLYPSGCNTCACCGFPEMDATPVCGECRTVGCEPGAPAATPTASATARMIPRRPASNTLADIPPGPALPRSSCGRQLPCPAQAGTRTRPGPPAAPAREPRLRAVTPPAARTRCLS